MPDYISAIFALDNISKTLALFAALGWSVSCFFWLMSARVKAVSSLPPATSEVAKGTVMTKGGFYVDGVPQMTTTDIQVFLNKSARLNKISATISSVSAALTALSVYFS
ncbi:MAG TPA: hypothetical protein VG519_13270 [Pseudochrobactrum sp.]|nr:hypothetical protein [Pseudochrobactrum sp.]